MTIRLTITIGPCAPTCTGCSEPQPAFRQNSLQWLPKFAAMAALLRPTVNPSTIRPASESALATVKTFCTSAPNFMPKMFTAASNSDNDDSGKIRSADADLHIAKHHGADGDGRNVRDVPQPMRAGNRRKEDAEKFAEGHANGGDGSGLNDEKERPAVEKAPQRTQRFAQVDILAAGLGHHGGQLAVAERADHGHDGGDDPGCQIERRRIGEARDIAVDDKDAAADHRSHNDGGGAEQAQALHQLRAGFRICSAARHGGYRVLLKRKAPQRGRCRLVSASGRRCVSVMVSESGARNDGARRGT